MCQPERGGPWKIISLQTCPPPKQNTCPCPSNDPLRSLHYPKRSMYGVYAYIYPIKYPNVGKSTIHGCYLGMTSCSNCCRFIVVATSVFVLNISSPNLQKTTGHRECSMFVGSMEPTHKPWICFCCLIMEWLAFFTISHTIHGTIYHYLPTFTYMDTIKIIPVVGKYTLSVRDM